MIAPIIPFFLLANVPNQTTWPNGPEFKFNVLVMENLLCLNRNLHFGFNATSEMICRPKVNDMIKCQLKFLHLVGFETNSENGALKVKELDAPLFETFQFEIGFDNKGVSKIIVSDSMNETYVRIAENMVNMLNVGLDLSNIQIKEDLLLELNQKSNYLLGKCPTNFKIDYKDETSDGDQSWNLDIVPPLEKFSERVFRIKRTWNSDCDTSNAFIWTSLLINDGINDPLLKFEEISNTMVFKREKFGSVTMLLATRPYENLTAQVSENTIMALEDIYSAQDTWPEIEHPFTILLNDDESTNETH